MRLLIGVLAAIAFSPTPGFADAQVHEWIGEYDMNHDGHAGTLAIRDSKADCGGPAWCAYVLSYTGRDGQRRTGTIETIDDHNQHMVFHVDFPGNRQRFDGYLFSWDKTKVAGLTYWGGRKFGFYAMKRQP